MRRQVLRLGGVLLVLRTAVWLAGCGSDIPEIRNRQVRFLKGPNKGCPVPGIALSPDGGTLASVTGEGDIHLWRLRNGALVRIMQKSRSTETSIVSLGVHLSVAFSPDGKLLAGPDAGHRLKMWRVSDGKELWSVASEAAAHRMAFSPDGRLLAAPERDGVGLWQVTDGAKLRTLTLTGKGIGAACVAFSPDGTLLAAGTFGALIHVWSVAEGKTVCVLEEHRKSVPSHFDATYAEVNGVAFSPDGKLLASASDDGTCRLWQVADWKELHTFGSAGGMSRLRVRCVAFSPDGKLLACGCEKETINLWRVSDGGLAGTLKLTFPRGPGGMMTDREYRGQSGINVWSLAFTPNGKELAAGSFGRVKVWDLTKVSGPR